MSYVLILVTNGNNCMYKIELLCSICMKILKEECKNNVPTMRVFVSICTSTEVPKIYGDFSRWGTSLWQMGG